jgi:tetratricopeptide (TPR) repeat protein
MRAFVFTDKSLSRHAGQFVWLEIDRENAKNSVFRRRFPVPGLPTFAIVDPVREAEQVRWVGGITVSQLHALLDDVAGHGDTPPALLVLRARADSLYGVANYAAAVPAFDSVLAAAPPAWKGYARVVDALMFSLGETGQDVRALMLAREALPRLGASTAGLSVASAALGAATSLPESLGERPAAIAEFEGATLKLVEDRSFQTAADDRSGAWIALLDARHDARDSLGARRVAQKWSAFLDGEAARARTPEERAVFDPHRLSAYLELGEVERAIPMLQQSERDLPGDYNPPARLAAAYRMLQRWDEALAASDRAMALAYGPRKLNFYETRADIFKGRGDLEGARRTLAEAIRYAQALPLEQQSAARIAALQRKLDTLPTR